jgi:hypothetical protein
MRHMRRGIALALVLASSGARADTNDLVLSRLGTAHLDSTGRIVSVTGQNLELRELSSQLGVVLAPVLSTPADSIGFSGFQLTVDYASTTIDHGAPYWRALEGKPSGMMQTVGFFARKGMWFPLPSIELGVGAVHLVDSHIWAGQLYTKLSLHEGYHDLPIPSVSVRGAVSRMMAQRELDLTIASLDVSVSKHFGIGGTWRLDPFAGWNLLMIVPRSGVIEGTPSIDPLEMNQLYDTSNDFTFKDQSTILRHRLFVGAKLQYDRFVLVLQAQRALAGSSTDDRRGTTTPCAPSSDTTMCAAHDDTGAQTTYSLSAGLEF